MNLFWDAFTISGDLYALWLLLYRVPKLERELAIEKRRWR